MTLASTIHLRVEFPHKFLIVDRLGSVAVYFPHDSFDFVGRHLHFHLLERRIQFLAIDLAVAVFIELAEDAAYCSGPAAP
jgi:hypothetical protein